MDVARIVKQVILDVAQERNSGVKEVSESQTLNADLRIESLDLARIISELEIELEFDPFQDGALITSIRTVGDLCRAYDKDKVEDSDARQRSADRAQERLAAVDRFRRERSV